MSHKTLTLIFYFVIIIPMTLSFLRFYLPWSGKSINNLSIRLIFLNIGMFTCFIPIYLVDHTFGFIYILLYISLVTIFSMVAVPSILRRVYSSNTVEVESFLKTNPDFFPKEKSLEYRMQKYAKLFYDKTEVSFSEYLLTLFIMTPIPSIIINQFFPHLLIYIFFIGFVPLINIVTFWSRLENSKNNH